MLQRFDPDRYYLTTDSELLLLGSPATLAQHRHEGKGPRYVRLGRRVLYRGCDLNEFLDQCVVEPTILPRGAPAPEPASEVSSTDIR